MAILIPLTAAGGDPCTVNVECIQQIRNIDGVAVVYYNDSTCLTTKETYAEILDLIGCRSKRLAVPEKSVCLTQTDNDGEIYVQVAHIVAAHATRKGTLVLTTDSNYGIFVVEPPLEVLARAGLL